jgi:hypothetical protein
MSDRFAPDERPPEHGGDDDLAARARQQMRAAVSNLRAGFGADLLSAEIGQAEPDEGDAADARFTKRRRDD